MRLLLSVLCTLAAAGCATIQDAHNGASGWDVDGDGFGSDEDCDDRRAWVYPGAPEECDGLDNDCNGEVDDGPPIDANPWYADQDGDGYGDPDAVLWACTRPEGRVGSATDCDDADPDIHPLAQEVCDEADTDEDCDGLADDADSSAVGRVSWSVDADGDGFGDLEPTTSACDAPDGMLPPEDCDDADATVFPGAADDPTDGTDSDCSCGGLAGDDSDGDGFADWECGGADCRDDIDVIHPDAVEICENGIDDNCDASASPCSPWGEVTPGDAVAAVTDGPVVACRDLTGDGYPEVLVDGTVATSPLGATTAMDRSARLQEAGGGTASVYGCVGDLDRDGYEDVLGYDGQPILGLGPWSGTATEVAYFDVEGLDVGAFPYFVGDATGDGHADLLVQTQDVAAHTYDARVLSGPLDASASVSANAAVTFDLSAHCITSVTAQPVGDLDGDGLVEVAVAGTNCDTTDPEILFFDGGGHTGVVAYSDADRVMAGGVSVLLQSMRAADWTGDGLPNVAVGAPAYSASGDVEGAALVLPSPLPTALSATDAIATLRGEVAAAGAGRSVAFVDDLDGDGLPELLVGAPGTRFESGTATRGRAYLVAGPVTGVHLLSSVASATYTGEHPGSTAGREVAVLGDVNADGIDEFLISDGAGGYLFSPRPW